MAGFVRPAALSRVFGLRNAGTSDEATHLHHAFVCAAGAALGAGAAWLVDMPLLAVAQPAWLACWIAYVVREIAQWRGQRWTWDAYGDVGVPVAWGILGLTGDPRQFVVWLGVTSALAAFYVWARPAPKADENA